MGSIPITRSSIAPVVPDLSAPLLRWFDRFGRHDLPWQDDRDPYRIWVSEVMLQQTQVTAVIPYFERFTNRFQNVCELADASIDEVLHLWTGLGYYARARNLHRTAGIVSLEFDGVFPRDPEVMRALPGIGRSTANAILAFAHGQRLPILDGNVKRVLTRYYGVHGWPGKASVQGQLWQLAEENTPEQRTADYTQAVMDLGATICVRRRPRCELCPLSPGCVALTLGEQEALPTRAPKKEKPTRLVNMVMIVSNGTVLLEQRPPTGIWGGLWSFPEVEPEGDIASDIQGRFNLPIRIEGRWDPVWHGFTHYRLGITPVLASAIGAQSGIMEKHAVVWYNPRDPDARGLAAPVKKLLNKLR